MISSTKLEKAAQSDKAMFVYFKEDDVRILTAFLKNEIMHYVFKFTFKATYQLKLME